MVRVECSIEGIAGSRFSSETLGGCIADIAEYLDGMSIPFEEITKKDYEILKDENSFSVYVLSKEDLLTKKFKKKGENAKNILYELAPIVRPLSEFESTLLNSIFGGKVFNLLGVSDECYFLV